MASIDVADETYVAVPARTLAPVLTARSTLGEWFPGLRFEVFMDRASKGTRWSVTGEMEGSVEVWLEPAEAGTVVHWFMRGEPTGQRDLASSYVDTLNARMFGFKDAAENGRGAP